MPTAAELEPYPRCFSLAALRQLARAEAARHPDRAEEWEIYLDTLEPYAQDGILPQTLDLTVREVFEEVLPSSLRL